jgi:hypothetical protein
MAKGAARKRAAGGPLQRLLDREAAAAAKAPLVGEHAARHGDYAPAAETGEMRRAMLNRGGTAIDRWRRDGLLSDSQQAAILHCQRLWRQIGSSGRLVSRLDRTVFGAPGEGNLAEIEARDDLHRIKSGFPAPYWDLFENVCRFDEPAGPAGLRLASDSRSAAGAARIVVVMVADTIYLRERLSY